MFKDGGNTEIEMNDMKIEMHEMQNILNYKFYCYTGESSQTIENAV